MSFYVFVTGIIFAIYTPLAIGCALFLLTSTGDPANNIKKGKRYIVVALTSFLFVSRALALAPLISLSILAVFGVLWLIFSTAQDR